MNLCRTPPSLKYLSGAPGVGTLSQCPHERESVIAGVYFSQTHFSWDLAAVHYYQGVPYSGVSTRRELTVVAYTGHKTEPVDT